MPRPETKTDGFTPSLRGRLLDSGRLATFHAVATTRGFARAARLLDRTQSSVSQAIAQLEAELGEKLFERGPHGTRSAGSALLTEAGRMLLPHAEAIFAAMGRARAQLEAARVLEAGELTIATSDTLACHFLPPLLAAFRKRYPRVDLRLDNRPSPAAALAVAERRAHVGVVSLPLPAGGEAALVLRQQRLACETLGPQTDQLICPPSHPLARRAVVRLADLSATLPDRGLLLLDRTTSSRAFIDEAFAAAGVQPLVTMEMSSVEVLKRLVELGFGCSIVPSWATRREQAAKTMIARRIRDLPAGRSVGLITPGPGSGGAQTETLPRATAAFVELARATLTGAGPRRRLL
ncbi:MAG TPA: LysR family transcriptional regulator [Polyangia bacterium]